MLTYTLEKNRGQSLYTSLYRHIRADIAAGVLKAGDRLPSKRALAANLGVGVVTVETAYAQLIAEGYARAVERSGVYVCAIGDTARPASVPLPPEPETPPQKPLLDLSGGGGEDVPFPFSVWVKTMRTVMAEQGQQILRPVDFRGAPELRRAISDHLYESRGMRVPPERIIVGAGNEHLYGLMVGLLGRQRIYAAEDPGYRKITEIYKANDVTLRHIPLDEEGLSVRALEKSGADIVHISPAHHYPTGIVMPIRRRNELLQWAYAQPERYILEDDYDSELRHSGTPVPPLFSLDSRERVLYLSTFSQTIAPSLRIAYVCLPGTLMERFCDTLGFYACAVPTFEQYTLAKFISSGAYEKHLNRLRKRYRDKRERLMELVAESPLGAHCRILEAGAGTHFLLQLQSKLSDAELREAAKERGLSLRFLSDYQSVPTDSGSLIFNYACLDLDRVPAALEILAELCRGEK